MERWLGWGGEQARCDACEQCRVAWPGAELQDQLLLRAPSTSCDSQ